jgi:hypothetical protein
MLKRLLIEQPVKRVGSYPNHEIFVQVMNGMEVHIYIDKQTGKKRVDTQDLSLALGFKNEEGMLASNDFLDLMNSYKKQTGEFPYTVVNNKDL